MRNDSKKGGNPMPILLTLILALAGWSHAQTAALPPPGPDGWIKLFRGGNTADFFIANNGKLSVTASRLSFPNATFTRLGDTLQSSGSPAGQVYFNRSFSRYRVRYQMRFPGQTGNCGMLYHVQADDTTTYGFPPSIESQGDPNQGMGQLWPIGDVWVDIKVKPTSQGLQWDPAGRDTVYGGKDWNSRMILGKDGWAKPAYASLSAPSGWVTHEVRVYGSDSVIHLVGDTVRIKYRNPRVSPGGTPGNVAKTLASGLIGWQSEGSRVWYREMQIMLLPGDPSYAPVYAAFDARNALGRAPPPKTLFLAEGLPGYRVRGNGNEVLFDLGGRAWPGRIGPTAPRD